MTEGLLGSDGQKCSRLIFDPEQCFDVVDLILRPNILCRDQPILSIDELVERTAY